MSTIGVLEDYHVAFAGFWRSLSEARRPAYDDIQSSRVALVSATMSIAPESEAGPSSETVPGRPGINPLYVEPICRVRQEYIDHLRVVSETVGIKERKRWWRAKGIDVGHEWNDDAYFYFGDSKFEAVDEGSEGVRYDVDDADREAIFSWVREADRTADWVVVALHSHQGPRGDRNVEGTPAFRETFAHDCVDAGADAFVTTGSHVLRGLELYDGKPIFYSLGNFALQLETVDRFPFETYQRFGVPDADKPSELFDRWFFDDSGTLRNDLVGDGPIWESIVPTCEFGQDGRIERIDLYPCWLQEARGPPTRGTPQLASGGVRGRSSNGSRNCPRRSIRR